MKADRAGDLRRYSVALYSVTFLVAGCAAVAIVACALGSLPDPIAFATLAFAAIVGVVAHGRPFSPACVEEFEGHGRIESKSDPMQGYYAARAAGNCEVDTDVAGCTAQGLEARSPQGVQAGPRGDWSFKERDLSLAASIDVASQQNGDGVIRGLSLPPARARRTLHISGSASLPLRNRVLK